MAKGEKRLPSESDDTANSRDISPTSSDNTHDIDEIVNQVVDKLKPEMQAGIDSKVSALVNSIKIELQDLRKSIQSTPQVATGGGGLDIEALKREAEKILPGVSGMFPQGSGGGTAGSQAQHANTPITNKTASSPPAVPTNITDPYEYAKWLEDNARNPQTQQMQLSQPQAGGGGGGGLNMGSILALVQILNTPVVSQLLGVSPQNQQMNQIMQAFMQMSMNNTMADIQLGSFMRKSLINQVRLNNPLMANDAQQALTGEDLLVGNALKTITTPVANNNQQTQQQQQGEQTQ